MPLDPFQGVSPAMDSPASHAAAVTPSDSANLTAIPRALLIASAGNLKVTMAGGEVVTLPVTAGYNPLRVLRVWSASKTCGDVVAIW